MDKFLFFDIETAKIIDRSLPWNEQRPYGISAASTLLTGEEPKLWYSVDLDYKPQMTQEDVCGLVRYLQEQVANGYVVVTFNGLKFDYDVLAEESGMRDECIDLAMGPHIDIMLDFFCRKGFFVALKKVARGLGVQGKSTGLSGADAPLLWAEGKCKEVLEYVKQDVRATMNIFNQINAENLFMWVTRKGHINSVSLDERGLLPVQEALRLPLPDTSWMNRSVERIEFYKWTLSEEERREIEKAQWEEEREKIREKYAELPRVAERRLPQEPERIMRKNHNG